MQRFLSAIVLVSLSCASPEPRREFADPITAADREPLPVAVTDANARQIVRQCLQAHRRSAGNAAHVYGYAFREAGFVQLYERPGESRDRLRRTYVDFASIHQAVVEDFIDVSKVSKRWEVKLEGRFRVWEGERLAYQPESELGNETGAAEVASLVLTFDDEAAARALVEALGKLK